MKADFAPIPCVNWKRFGASLFCVLMVVVGAFFSIVAQPAQANALRTGISVFGDSGLGEQETEAQRIKRAGSTFVLHWLRWDSVAPSTRPDEWDPTDPVDPAYDWSGLDQRVIEAREAGLSPILQIWGTPKWAQGCSPPADRFVLASAPCNPKPGDLADFAKAAARRFSGGLEGLPRVRHWQVLNEPNLHVFFNPQFNARGTAVSPAIYRKILNVVYPAIKSVHASNVVLAAGLAPNWVPGSLSPMDFSRRLLCMNRANRPIKRSRNCSVKLDVFDMHPYTSGGPNRKAAFKGNVQMGNLPELRALLKAADKAGRIKGSGRRTPLWITEMSWDSRPPDPGGVPMRILKRWTSEALYRAWKSGVRTFLWYSLRDQSKGNLSWSETTQSGFYFRGQTMEQDKPKPSLRAFRFPAVAFSRKGGAMVWGRTPESKSGWVAVQIRGSGNWRRLGRVRANSNGLFHGFVRSGLASRQRGSIRMVYGTERSVPFGLKPVRDWYQRPFG